MFLHVFCYQEIIYIYNVFDGKENKLVGILSMYYID